MSSALDFSGLSRFDNHRCTDFFFSVRVILNGPNQSKIEQVHCFSEGAIALSPRKLGWRIYRRVVRDVCRAHLSEAVWRRNQGPRLLNKALRYALSAHFQSLKGHGVIFEIDTTVATDSVAFCWGAQHSKQENTGD